MFTLQKPWYVFQLGNIVRFLSTFILEKRKRVIELFTGMRRVQLGKLVENCFPKIQDNIIT